MMPRCRAGRHAVGSAFSPVRTSPTLHPPLDAATSASLARPVSLASRALAGGGLRGLTVGLQIVLAAGVLSTPSRAQQALNGGTATGAKAHASGTGAVADGLQATAIGNASRAHGDNATAVGQSSTADGVSASSVGQNSRAQGDYSSAFGQGSVANGYTASAYGQNSRAEGTYATAVGNSSYANGGSATVVGQNAQATGGTATAVGSASKANGASASAYGVFSNATGGSASAYGMYSAAIGEDATAIGNASDAQGTSATALGQNSHATGADATATGSASVADGADASAYGVFSNAKGDGASAIGMSSNATGVSATALGVDAAALADRTTALGQGARADLAGAVAIGQGSRTSAASSIAGNPAAGITANAGAVAAGSGNVVSVGSAGSERQIQNVAAGAVRADSTDAVNGSQLYGLASTAAGTAAKLDALGTGTAAALGGGATYAGATGVTGLSYGLNGSDATYTTVVGGQQALANGSAGLIQYATPGLPSDAAVLVGTGGPLRLGNVANGAVAAGSTDAVNGSQLYALATDIEADVTALNAGLTAVGRSVQAGPPGGGSDAGPGASAQGHGAPAIGVGSVASGQTALGATDHGGVVAAGPGSAAPVVAAGTERQIQNVAAGAVTVHSTDAVNGSQLYRVASDVDALGTATARAVGGNTTYSAAAGLTGTHYALNGSTARYTDVVSGQQAIAAGAAGPVQYATPGTVSNSLNLVGRGQPVTLGNVAAGAVSSTSLQAVNGGQLHGTASSVASALGGGAAVGADGALRAPSYQVGSQRYGDVGSALAALENDSQAGLASLSDDLNRGLRRANGGIAAAMAGNGIRFDNRPGKVSTGIGIASWRGEMGLAGGLGATSEDGQWTMNATVMMAPSSGGQTDVGVAGGLSYTLN